MKRFLMAGFLMAVAAAAHFGGTAEPPTLAVAAELPARAVAVADEVSRKGAEGEAAAIGQLRAMGPAGLEALLAARPEGKNDKAWRAAVDRVAMQREAATSRLYWYTDIEEAKLAAKQTGKPILSLRLLGNLNEEYSCANSRFFRTVLYANKEVSQFLRDRFVLHWKSVRPVPRVTIDFGDGRKIETTITGNSIHYVLDAEGRPIDAIPGLYGPKAFLRVLKAAAEVQGAKDVPSFHLAQLQRQFVPSAEDVALDEQSRVLIGLQVGAAQAAGNRAIGKGAGENPVLRAIGNFGRTLSEDTRINEAVLHRQLHEWFASGEVNGDVEALNRRVYGELFLMPLDDQWLGLKSSDVYTGL